MSKYIKLTDDKCGEIRKAFEETLAGGKFPDGKFTFSKSIGETNREATVYFSELAWLKMQALIYEFDTEVAWHGIAKRGEDPEKDEYFITDILVYPQNVDGTTVITDQTEYQTWLMEQDDDTFDNIRFHGHSHVNMGTTPSGVDISLQEKILAQLEDDMFYIFMIWNKKGNCTAKIYDLLKNTLFETADITVDITDDGVGVENFVTESKRLVREKARMLPTKFSTYWKSKTCDFSDDDNCDILPEYCDDCEDFWERE